MPDRKYGRIRPVTPPHRDPTVRQYRAANAPLAPPPSSCDWSGKQTYPIDLNDQIGDCAIASLAHWVQAASFAASGAATVFSDRDCLEAYSAVSGYTPGNPASDVGCVLSEVYTHWKSVGVGGNRNIEAMALRPSQLDHIKWAIVTFGGCIFGVDLPQSAEDQTDANEPWTIVTGSPIVGGHAILIYGYDATSFHGWSWVNPIKISYSWHVKYTTEAWTFRNDIWVGPGGLTANGLNATSLDVDAGLI